MSLKEEEELMRRVLNWHGSKSALDSLDSLMEWIESLEAQVKILKDTLATWDRWSRTR